MIEKENPMTPSTTPRCGAKTKHGPCRAFPIKGKARCKNHGGLTPGGIASPNYKHGRYSKVMPQRIGEIAYAAAHDPELLNLRPLIGVYEARIQMALSELDTSGGYERLARIRDVHKQFRDAWRAKDSAAIYAAIAELDKAVYAAGYDFDLWREIDTAAINLKKLMESERKRQIEMNALLPAALVSDFAANILMIVRDEVTDPSTWGRVQARVTDLIGSKQRIMQGVASEN